ncbi:hypothetical protein IMZ11_17695 [Microtetraspora sp. AC03309]|uniref:hypothetical protein n=1 Tax=Microtetraspora sp. AC03309 TaxID=2779376 RepID=UPI001E4EC239|nr:hypothetical protein [Microtetraspora sp. AC03309]MCC5577460.1 hypothetical protein [Microtetraspora sp. AC03309]
MPGSQLGRLSLRADAVYCLVVGLIVAATAPLTTTTVQLPALVIAAVGSGVVLWAGVVWWLSFRPLRDGLRLVLAANVLAASVLAAVSFAAASIVVLMTFLAIAIDVGGFAASQIVALKRMSREAF